MKIWSGFGTEHSSNLVMIGRFKTPEEATSTERLFQELIALATKEMAPAESPSVSSGRRFSGAMIELMQSNRVSDLTPSEQEQFTYDFQVKRNGSELVVRTEEIDVMALIKVLIDREAKVEVYSAHFHGEDGAPDSGD